MNEAKRVPNTLNWSQTYSSLVHSTLKLFNGIPVDNQKRKNPSESITRLTINHGFVFSPQVYANYSENELRSMIETISEEIGISPAQMNSSFHKSWTKVRDAPIFQLVAEQIFHYMTTYGYESFGVYDPDMVFIPNEKLELPELTDGIKLTVIKGYTKKQLKEKLLNLLDSGIALKSVEEVVTIAKFCELVEEDLLLIKNKEVRVRLYHELGVVPTEPLELLRLAVFKSTNESLLIVNKKTIEAIKESTVNVTELFEEYDRVVGYKRLAEIFLRFKPLFLAFKSEEKMKPIINRISVLSHKYHEPMYQALMNNVTGLLKNEKKVSVVKLKNELAESNIFRKIRLAYALNYRMTGASSILYKIRNGKGYAEEMSFDNIDGAKKIYDIVLKSIVDDLGHLKGKKIYIPNNVKYALPATEKQFTGNIPSGTCITVPQDLIFGVYWNNVGSKRIDIDLSVISIKGGKIGWNGRWRSDNVLFSGDMTDATNGASELFYINKHFEDTMLLYANFYNFEEKVKVPIKVIVAKEHPNSFGCNYMVDPNHIECVAKTDIIEEQKVLGLIKVEKGECKFYFSETGLGKSITSGSGKHSDLTRDYLSNFVTNMITLNDVLVLAGATVTGEKTKDAIDLSPESIEKSTFINLLTNR